MQLFQEMIARNLAENGIERNEITKHTATLMSIESVALQIEQASSDEKLFAALHDMAIIVLTIAAQHDLPLEAAIAATVCKESFALKHPGKTRKGKRGAQMGSPVLKTPEDILVLYRNGKLPKVATAVGQVMLLINQLKQCKDVAENDSPAN